MQPDLLSWEPSARRTDPETSHLAATDAAMNASRGRMLVLKHLSVRPMTDFELEAATGWPQTSIGKRRGECRDAGLVEMLKDSTGAKVRRASPSNSLAQVWQITASGRAFFEKNRN